jgi:hypothetical protein
MRAGLRSILDAILCKVPGKTSRLDTARRMAMDADFSDHGEPPAPARELRRKGDQQPRAADVDPLEELMRIVGEREPDAPRRRRNAPTFPRRR